LIAAAPFCSFMTSATPLFRTAVGRRLGRDPCPDGVGARATPSAAGDAPGRG